MAPDHDPDDERTTGGPPLPPDDRLWRHPSELGRPASPDLVATGATVAVDVRRTSRRGVLAGACLAGALVAFGALMLSRPMPGDDLRRGELARGTTVSISSTVTSLLAPMAIAANPINRAQSVPLGNAAAPGRLLVEIADGEGAAAVVTVRAGGPADTAGITAGDVIVAVGGTPVADAREVLVALAPTRPGQTIAVSIQRGEQTLVLPVALG